MTAYVYAVAHAPGGIVFGSAHTYRSKKQLQLKFNCDKDTGEITIATEDLDNVLGDPDPLATSITYSTPTIQGHNVYVAVTIEAAVVGTVSSGTSVGGKLGASGEFVGGEANGSVNSTVTVGGGFKINGRRGYTLKCQCHDD